MHMRMRSSAAGVFLAAALSGCVAQDINPVTGKPIYTPVPTSTEARLGEKAGEKMVASFGIYREDSALTAYVDRIGQALAKNVVRKGVHYTFAILDDEDINAYALPGGYVYLTRGALNFANSEEEIAAILGHEIGHVDAFHFGRGGEDNSVKRILSVLLKRSSSGSDDLALAQKLADESTRSAGYSQGQELEADALATHYLALAGYNPHAIVTAIRTEDAKTTIDIDQIKANPVAQDIFALDQSHPATPAREAHAEEAAKTADAKLAAQAPAPVPVPVIDRNGYLAMIDGMKFGVDPEEGSVDGRRMVNPFRGFSFEAPEDFDLWVSRSGATGVGRKAVLILDTSEKYNGQSLATYVQTAMMDDLDVTNVRPLEIEGYRGATGIASFGPFTVRLAAVHDTGDHLYQLLYVAARRDFNEVDAGFLGSAKSFHPLKGAEAKAKPALRLKIITAAQGDTVQSLADRMAIKDKKLEWFRVLNGLEADDTVKPGDRIKLVQ